MAGFENPLWKQVQKITLTPDGTLVAPVTADGTDGIVVGEPPLGVPPAVATEPGLLVRVWRRLWGRA